MRLINVRTEALEQFWDVGEIKYAILSHRWGDEEISFQEYGTDASKDMKGYSKISSSCMQALHDGLDYLWVDTCCINKESSAELSEALNSMYRWYQESTVCYAFLSDVENVHLGSKRSGSLAASAWFTRGWTLQELLAPKAVAFYDHAWNFIGTKQTLCSALSTITGIDSAVLKGENIFNRSIAQRMSWAAARATTRIEDIAYCLLGIFDINMPILYGEGPKAFIRLQEHIIQQSDDHSIFAWVQDDEEQPGLLAASPKAFGTCKYVRPLGSRKGRSPFSMTNRGLSCRLDALPWSVDTYLVKLDCVDELVHVSDKEGGQGRMGMFLRRLAEDDQFARVRQSRQTFLHVSESRWEPKRVVQNKSAVQCRRLAINVRQEPSRSRINYLRDRVNGFRLANSSLLERLEDGKDRFKILAPTWNPSDCILSGPPGRPGVIGLVDISMQSRRIKAIKLGFDFDFNPVCFVAEAAGLVRPVMPDGHAALGPRWQPDIEERTQFEMLSERSCFDEVGWSIVANGTAMPLKHHHGLWALKGDRINGLSVRLGDGETNSTKIEIKRGEFNDQYVWDVNVSGLKDSYIRRINDPNPPPRLSYPIPPLAGPMKKVHRKAVGSGDDNTVRRREQERGRGREREREMENAKVQDKQDEKLDKVGSPRHEREREHEQEHGHSHDHNHDQEHDHEQEQRRTAFQRFKANW